MKQPAVLMVSCLLLAVVVSGVAVVWVKNESRALFVQLQSVRAEHQVAMMEWKNQQLELATVGSLEEVSRQAQQRLHMHIPQAGSVVVVN